MRAALMGVTGAAAVLMLTACNPAKIGEHRNERPMVAATRLDCPARQGDLVRNSLAADGRSCGYAGPKGQEVTLELVALNGRAPQAVLTELETELKQAAPQAAAFSAADSAGAGTGADAADKDGDTDGDRVGDRGGDGNSGDEAHINLPGLHINTDGDRAQVNLPGVHINANGDKADVQVDKPGGKLVSIHADERGAEVRTGEITAKNVNASYVLASKEAGQDGSHAVGYVARGPVSGPLVVARVRSQGETHDGDDLLRSVHRMVDRNVRKG